MPTNKSLLEVSCKTDYITIVKRGWYIYLQVIENRCFITARAELFWFLHTQTIEK